MASPSFLKIIGAAVGPFLKSLMPPLGKYRHGFVYKEKVYAE